MSSAVASIDIDRPVPDVFRFVAEPANEPFWHTDVVNASLEPAGPPAAGKVLHALFRTMGRTYPAIADVTAQARFAGDARRRRRSSRRCSTSPSSPSSSSRSTAATCAAGAS